MNFEMGSTNKQQIPLEYSLLFVQTGGTIRMLIMKSKEIPSSVTRVKPVHPYRLYTTSR